MTTVVKGGQRCQRCIRIQSWFVLVPCLAKESEKAASTVEIKQILLLLKTKVNKQNIRERQCRILKMSLEWRQKEGISEKQSRDLGSEDRQELNLSSTVGFLHGLYNMICFLSHTRVFIYLVPKVIEQYSCKYLRCRMLCKCRIFSQK